MEYVELIASLIGSLGFPIICCGALFWYVTMHTDKQNKEIGELKTIIERNTEVLTDLKDIISLLVGSKK